MMLILYNLGIKLYYMLAVCTALFSKKAKAWVNGRRQQRVMPVKQSIWFHFASLGEFEQGRPVLEAVKEKYPTYPIVITFFSPSGYQIRKNTALADAVYYLPIDTPENARTFIDTIKPVVAIFTKYEYWYHYFNELHRVQIPLYVISAIFRPQQAFFKWYGGLHRAMLRKVTCFFVQDAASVQSLDKLGIKNVLLSGDTRFDRVWANAAHPKALPVIKGFKVAAPVFIAGSTWPADENLLASVVKRYPGWKFIFAPHEISEDKISKLLQTLPVGKTIRYSQIEASSTSINNYQCLIIDNIGMLSALYQYADVAYIGGGFGVGIHNTLEAAAFGLPVIFGPNYARFKEAIDLISLHAGFSISTQEQLDQVVDRLINDEKVREMSENAARTFVAQSQGATNIIMQNIKIK
ncbi:glycosyltransferase N-terminal domain-containing protein [Mucilaginibacter sp. CSA2-8R]|uniref:3-deoxy-D-manno-octulosonic acid transferase n=1 Tax=Mucilaginibacter sp. CSA2-8R TaxID=3141542 RepID=UPI00315C83B6